MKTILLLISAFWTTQVLAQTTSLIDNADTRVSYSFAGSNLVMSVEDLQPLVRTSTNEHAYNPDFKEELDFDYCIIEFDKNGDKKVNKGDVGFHLRAMDNHSYGSFTGFTHCNYQLYEGFPGVFMNGLSRGCDNKTTKATMSGLWKSSEAATAEHPIWQLTIPVAEVLSTSTKEISVRIKVYRSKVKEVFCYPALLDGNSFTGISIPYAKGAGNASSGRPKSTTSSKQKTPRSSVHYLNSIVYDGVYIETANGKFVKLTQVQPQAGVIAATSGGRVREYLMCAPFVESDTTAVTVPTIKKIIFKGTGLSSGFFDALYISQLENINEQHLTYTGDGNKDDVHSYALAGQFGSSYSVKSHQPEVLLTPHSDKEKYHGHIVNPCDRRTVSETRTELSPTYNIEVGKVYAIWFNGGFWLFKKT